MLIYIRHSDDEDNHCTKLHDCELSEYGKKLAQRVGKRMIEKYGIPTIIYYSPFRRTTQTMDNMLMDINRDNMTLIKEVNLSRYFSSKEKRNPSIDKETAKLDIPIHEHRNEFKLRIDEFSNLIYHHVSSNEIVWAITHAIVYKNLAKKYYISIPKHIPFMDYFIVSKSRRIREYCKDCKKFH